MNKKNIFLLFLAIACGFLYTTIPMPIHVLGDAVTRTAYRLTHVAAKTDSLVLAAIDDTTLSVITQKWPFSRALYAQVIDTLNEAGAGTIAFDIIFSGAASSAADDAALAGALERARTKTILAALIGKHAVATMPHALFRAVSQTGFINSVSDSDGVIRRLRVYGQLDSVYDFAFFLKTLSAHYGRTTQLKDDGIYTGNIKIPLDDSALMRINYQVKPADITTIPLSDILNGTFSKDAVRAKTVLIAPTSEIIHDICLTPLGRIPGVFVHINAFLTAEHRNFLKPVPWLIELLAAIVLCVIAAFLAAHFSFLKACGLNAGVVLGAFWISIGLRTAGIEVALDALSLAVCTCFSISCGYMYFEYIVSLERIKKAMLTNHVTGLWNSAYFYEQIYLMSQYIGYQRYSLIVMLLPGLRALGAQMPFNEYTAFWKGLRQNALPETIMWSSTDEETLVGLTRTTKHIEAIRMSIRAVCLEHKMSLPIKTGIVAFKSSIPYQNIMPLLREKIAHADQDILTISACEIPAVYTSAIAQKRTHTLEMLSGSAEEKNRQLRAALEKLQTQHMYIKKTYWELISSLVNALESKDPYTTGHSQRVCRYAELITDALGLPAEEKEKIRKAATLHDIGKIGIPDGILHKKGKLTEEEFSVIKEHPVRSAKILEPIAELRTIIPYVLHHHEKFDGTGYPHGLASGMIPLGARIIAAADVFDALMTGRDYKAAFSSSDAVTELERGKGKHFDAQVIDAFIAALIQQRIIEKPNT